MLWSPFFLSRWHIMKKILCLLALAALIGGSGSRSMAQNLSTSVTSDGGSATYVLSPRGTYPPVDAIDFLDWPDNYGDNIVRYGYSRNAILISSTSGGWDDDRSGGVKRTITLSDPLHTSMGPGAKYYTIASANDGSHLLSAGVIVPHVQGVSVAMVVTPEIVNGAATGNFVDVPGATISMYQVFDNYGPCNPFDGTAWAIPALPPERSYGGKKLTYAIFGDPGNSGAVKSDAPYPSGPSRQMYSFFASAPGYKSAIGSAAHLFGYQWPGQSVVIVLAPNSSSNSSSISSPSGTDPTGGASTDAAGPSGSTPPASSGDGGASAFFSGFWDKVTSFFTLQQPDIDALKLASSNLAGYGPLSLPHQIKDAFDGAFSAPGTDGSQADYWVIPLHVELDGPLSAYPSGYNGANTPMAPLSNTIYTNLFPASIDMSPYARWILLGRSACLILLWVTVGFNILKRFTPDLRV